MMISGALQQQLTPGISTQHLTVSNQISRQYDWQNDRVQNECIHVVQ